MGHCLKGQSEVEKRGARYACEKCGAAAAKKDHLCKPEKLSEDKKDRPDKKEKKPKKK